MSFQLSQLPALAVGVTCVYLFSGEMRRTIHVEQAVDLLFQDSDEEEETLCSSSSDDGGGDHIEDPDFVVENGR